MCKQFHFNCICLETFDAQELKTCIQSQDVQILQNVLSTMNPQVFHRFHPKPYTCLIKALNQHI